MSEWHGDCSHRGVDKEALSNNRTAEFMMTHNPVTSSVSDSLNVTAQRMWEHDGGALPVVDGTGHVVGMITDRDVAIAAYTQGKPLAQIVVKSAVSVDLWCVRPHSPISEVEMLMWPHQVGRIPVVDGELTQTLAAVCEPRPR